MEALLPIRVASLAAVLLSSIAAGCDGGGRGSAEGTRDELAAGEFAGGGGTARPSAPAARRAPAGAPTVGALPARTVERVVDGDTVVLDGGERVRLIGIDTPETVDPRRPVQWYGKEASDRARSLLAGRGVRVEYDVARADRYGRTLAYLYLEDGTQVNLVMIEDGYAFASRYPPNVRYADSYSAAQRAAREAGKGLWADAARAEAIRPKSR